MADNKNPGYAVAVLDDMFFASKIREAAKAAGVDMDFIKGAEGIIDRISSTSPSLVIVDLAHKKVDPIELIKELKGLDNLKGARFIGYLPHVETGLKKEAVDAGYDMVLPRSRFSLEMREIISRFAAGNDRPFPHQ